MFPRRLSLGPLTTANFVTLSEKATVQMPIQKTFWAARFGMLVDQFGTPWMVNGEKAAA